MKSNQKTKWKTLKKKKTLKNTESKNCGEESENELKKLE